MKEDCDNCQHQGICKWCDDFQRVTSTVNKVEFDKMMSPISTTVKCKSFQKKIQSYDGFFVDGGRR